MTLSSFYLFGVCLLTLTAVSLTYGITSTSVWDRRLRRVQLRNEATLSVVTAGGMGCIFHGCEESRAELSPPGEAVATVCGDG